MKLKCNLGCEGIFEVKDKQYTYNAVNYEGMTELFYECSLCGHPYHVAWENENTLKLYNDIVEERTKQNKYKENWQIRQSQEAIKKLVTRRKKLLEGLDRDAKSRNIKNISERYNKIQDKK